MILVAYDTVTKRIATFDADLSAGSEFDITHEYLVLTSKLYPVIVIESMDAVASLLGAKMYTWDVGEIDPRVTLIAGELRTPLQAYVITPEGVDASANFLSGELRVLLVSYSVPAEAVDASADFLSGILRGLLITYTNWTPEGVDASANFIAGSLT